MATWPRIRVKLAIAIGLFGATEEERPCEMGQYEHGAIHFTTGLTVDPPVVPPNHFPAAVLHT